ncbi:hypothetical protein B0H63DRAFT_548151 [Podospora didyma]|uniref:DUF6594 domain-containing protein n=1 Tax=Podospora didyma TaxID=330526 RepID=A0AAE0ND26_9PEZI|nr:hypothetical protein B0H63DRAFT_548151 [Podospora didyma]
MGCSFASDENAAEMGLTQGPSSSSHQGIALTSIEKTLSRGIESSAADSQSCVSRSSINVDEFMLKNCRYGDDYEKHPVGWPRLAAIQQQFSNADIFRSFDYIGLRLILHAAARVAFLEDKLAGFDNDQSTTPLRSLTESQTRPPGHSHVNNDYDTLMADLKEAYLEHTTLLCKYRDLRQLHPVPRPHYRDMLRCMIEEGKLDRDAYGWMKSPDEFVSISEPPHRLMLWLLYSTFGKWLMKKAVSQGSTSGGSSSRFLRQDFLGLVARLTMAITGVLVVSIPLGILYLGGLNNPRSFGAIVGFAIMFTIGMVITQEVDTHKVLFGVCGFMAVLVTVAGQRVPAAGG